MGNVKFKFDLGDKVEDKVTGFVGVVVAHCQHLNGCIQYSLKNRHIKDGVPVENVWVDEGQLEIVESDTLKIQKRDTGGPSTGSMPKM